MQQSIGLTRHLKRVAGPMMRVEALARRLAYLPFGIRCLLTARKAA